METWPYGTVGEILHVGPYNAMTPTVSKLADFVKSKGYELDKSSHEEVYLKAPGTFFKGDPATYKTIIRYKLISVTNGQ